MKLYLSRDSAALSIGADRVAHALAQALPDAPLIRTGSYGLYWLEPLLEVERDGQRLAFGPLAPADIPALVACGFDPSHKLCLGETAQIPALARQTRLTFARCGRVDPLDIGAYRAEGGLAGLEAALALRPVKIVEQVTESGLRGRGGAAFPTGIKWQTVLGCDAAQKYIVCNADEGDSGTFADRMIMEGDPFCLIEGMVIAGLAVGADMGYIYLRSEYPHARDTLRDALHIARDNNLLGQNILDSGKAFEIDLRMGAGAYICGEETALLESLEGKRGMIRFKPPLPAIKGLFGMPTVVNNVITLCSVPGILAHGPQHYASHGEGRSKGTLTIQLAGNVKYPGLYELDFGLPLRDLLYEIGGGTATGRPIRAVQCGGPLGQFIPASNFDMPLTYEGFAEGNAMLGHGGVVVFDDTINMAQMARRSMQFGADESCGKCTPCRIGTTRGYEVIERIIAGQDRPANKALLDELCTTLIDGSLCAHGGLIPSPVQSALQHFPEDFGLEREPA